jgi:hypothetical protein
MCYSGLKGRFIWPRPEAWESAAKTTSWRNSSDREGVVQGIDQVLAEALPSQRCRVNGPYRAGSNGFGRAARPQGSALGYQNDPFRVEDSSLRSISWSETISCFAVFRPEGPVPIAQAANLGRAIVPCGILR